MSAQIKDMWTIFGQDFTVSKKEQCVVLIILFKQIIRSKSATPRKKVSSNETNEAEWKNFNVSCVIDPFQRIAHKKTLELLTSNLTQCFPTLVYHVSHFTSQASCVTCHMSCVMCQMISLLPKC